MSSAVRAVTMTPPISSALALDTYFVKEHDGLFKAANNFDLYDPTTGQIVLLCREESLGLFTKLLRFTYYKRLTPFDISVPLEVSYYLLVRRGAPPRVRAFADWLCGALAP